jgi:hypothetical protein
MNTPVWRKSSHSGSVVDSDCVEVADFAGAIGVRDSKNPDGPHLTLSGRSFATLIGRVKAGRLDLP